MKRKMKVGRPRNFSMSVTITEGPIQRWRGHWKTFRDGKRMRRTITLGLVRDVAEETAWKILRETVEQEEFQVLAARHISEVPSAFSVCPPRSAQRSANATIAELMVAADLLSKGFEVFQPASHQCSCDLLILSGARPVRIEVKSVLSGNADNLKHRLLRNAGKYDVVAIVAASGITYTDTCGIVLGDYLLRTQAIETTGDVAQ